MNSSMHAPTTKLNEAIFVTWIMVSPAIRIVDHVTRIYIYNCRYVKYTYMYVKYMLPDKRD
jgi:hypothetical protein